MFVSGVSAKEMSVGISVEAVRIWWALARVRKAGAPGGLGRSLSLEPSRTKLDTNRLGQGAGFTEKTQSN